MHKFGLILNIGSLSVYFSYIVSIESWIPSNSIWSPSDSTGSPRKSTMYIPAMSATPTDLDDVGKKRT